MTTVPRRTATSTTRDRGSPLDTVRVKRVAEIVADMEGTERLTDAQLRSLGAYMKVAKEPNLEEWFLESRLRDELHGPVRMEIERRIEAEERDGAMNLVRAATNFLRKSMHDDWQIRGYVRWARDQSVFDVGVLTGAEIAKEAGALTPVGAVLAKSGKKFLRDVEGKVPGVISGALYDKLMAVEGYKSYMDDVRLTYRVTKIENVQGLVAVHIEKTSTRIAMPLVDGVELDPKVDYELYEWNEIRDPRLRIDDQLAGSSHELPLIRELRDGRDAFRWRPDKDKQPRTFPVSVSDRKPDRYRVTWTQEQVVNLFSRDHIAAYVPARKISVVFDPSDYPEMDMNCSQATPRWEGGTKVWTFTNTLVAREVISMRIVPKVFDERDLAKLLFNGASLYSQWEELRDRARAVG